MRNLKPIKKLLLISLLCMISATTYRTHAQDKPQQYAEKLLDQIVVVVNNDAILLSELERTMDTIKKRIRSQKINPPPEKELRKQVLDHMILEKLQLDQAERNGIVIDDLTLNATLKNIIAAENLSLEQFKKKLEATGIDYVEYREDLRRQIIIDRLNNAVVNSFVVTSEQEIDDYLANAQGQNENIEYLVSHIQVSIPESARPEDIQTAEKEAEDIFKKLQAGGDFAQLAVSYSDARDALDGGDLGWNRLSELPSAFTKTIGTLKPGEYSRPLRSARGFHILLLHDTKGVKRHVIEQVHARHILMKANTLTSDEQVHAKISELRKQLLQGADFAKLAAEFSEDPGSKDKAGDLGWAEPRSFVGQFMQVITTLPVNKLSEPFKTEYGWHIVQVLGRRNYDNTREYQREQARHAIFRRKAAIEQEMWLRRLRSEAYIDYRIDI
ncbi:MAG TPA: peptidylprolyl isomerase [Gammaproteobacteria bacterium]